MPRQPQPWRRGGPDGPWYAQVAGRKVRLADPTATKEEARDVLYRVLAGTAPETAQDGRWRVVEALDAYLAVRRQKRATGALAASSWDRTWRRCRALAVEFGETPCPELTPEAVERWFERQGWGASYRRRILIDLQCALRAAVRAGRLEVDPLARLRRPPATRREFDAPVEIRERILAHCPEPFKSFAEAVAETGCRPIELARLTAADVDLEGGVLRVANKTAHATGRAVRTVYLSARARAIVADLVVTHPTGPLFRSGRGACWKPSAWGEAWRLAREAAGLPEDFVLYDLRHAFATDALAAGVNPFVVAELMGHSNPVMLQKHYSKIVQRREALRAAVDQIRPGVTVPTPPRSQPPSADRPAAARARRGAADPAPGTPGGSRRGRAR